MKKYEKLVSDIINNVGGKDNVISVRHCITRLRFRLKDESIANDEVLKHMDGVISIVKAAGEYMVVIGEHVGDVYDEVCQQLGISDEYKNTQENEEKKSFLTKALELVMAAMGPTLNLLCASGILKGILVILTFAGLSAESGIYMLLNAAGDALFMFMPLFLSFNVAKKLGIDPYFGFLLGAALSYPAVQGVDIHLFGYVVNATYTASFLPGFFGVLISVPIYKFLDKHLPVLVKGFLVPLVTLLITFPLTFIVVGPFANMLGYAINDVMNFLFINAPLVGCTLLAGTWQILVMFGVHGIPTMFAFYALLEGHPSALLASVGGCCFAVAGVLLGVTILAKDKEFKATSGSAALSAILGVTEPGMYGVIVPRKKLLVLSCLAGAVGGFICGIFQIKAYTYAGMGVIGLLGSINPENPQILPIIILLVLPFVAGLVMTLFFYKNKDDKDIKKSENKELQDNSLSIDCISIYMPVSGDVENISASSDNAFASQALGSGIVVFPENNEIVAPVSGTVKTLFPTKHAIGIETDDGCQVLIHIGINTVNLQGKYFESLVKQGDVVRQGQLLIHFDKEAIEKEGYSCEVLMVITNSSDYADVIPIKNEKLNSGEEIIKIITKRSV